MYSTKATNSEDEPVPINTRVVASNVLFHLFFCTVRLVELYKVICERFILFMEFVVKSLEYTL
jgi:hypothetical protein